MAPFKIAVFSDTHGNKTAMRDALNSAGPFDELFHLGDGVEDGAVVAKEYGLVFQGVEGNIDYSRQYPPKLNLKYDTWSFMLLHGYQMNLNAYHPAEVWQEHLKEMAQWAAKERAHVLLFGHTHAALLKRQGDVVICNPGDQYIGASTQPSFASIEGQANFLEINLLRNNPDGSWKSFQSLRLVQKKVKSGRKKKQKLTETSPKVICLVLLTTSKKALRP